MNNKNNIINFDGDNLIVSMFTIPKKIFQTHKSILFLKSKPKIRLCMHTWKRFSDNFEYYFYTNDLCDKFMRENFDERVNRAYSCLPLGVMKADLWRYCVIYKFGGIYADADTICKINPEIFINNSYITIVPENNVHLCQWVFSAPMESPILKAIIDLSVERILTTKVFKGEHLVHELTGPGVFTDGIELYLKKNNLPIYLNKKEYYNYHNKHWDKLKVFNNEIFHNKFVQHIFTGNDFDGWCNERNNKLLK